MDIAQTRYENDSDQPTRRSGRHSTESLASMTSTASSVSARPDSVRGTVSYLDMYTDPVKVPERTVIGREKQMSSVLSAFERPEVCNVILLGPAGSGKTALVQGLSQKDSGRMYLELDLSRMIADARNSDEVGAMLKGLFDEVIVRRQQSGKDIVIFMDEFHQIVQVSSSGVEAMKPILADSGTRGVRIIAATTFVEFREWISPNQPLVERLLRINMPEMDRMTTVKVLAGMAERYGVLESIRDKSLFGRIYDMTNKHIPANAQPRKSLLVLDSMIGHHRFENRPIDDKLLADVIYESEGVNVAFKVDGMSIKEALDKRVIAQQLATSTVEQRLQLCVAGLNNPTKPQSVMLLTGSSGVGKTELAKALTDIMFDDRRALQRHDMTEYANSDSLERFRDELTARTWERPYCVILLDEIEKACAEVTRLLLQVLDDGRLSDRNGRQVSFVNSHIIMTTNAASEIYKTIGSYAQSDTGDGSALARYQKLIRRSITATTGDNRFPPELLGRTDAIVPFQPLSRETQETIIKMKLGELTRRVMDTHGVRVDFDKSVIEYLIENRADTDTESGGARGIISILESDVSTEIARFINTHPNYRKLYVNVKGLMASEHKNRRDSDAKVVIQVVR